MARVKPAEPVTYEVAKAAMGIVRDGIAARLATLGYDAEVTRDRGYGYPGLKVTKSSDLPSVELTFDTMRAAGFGGVWARDVRYKPGAVAKLMFGPGTRDTFRAYFAAVDGKADPARGTGWDDLVKAIEAAIIFAGRRKAVQAKQDAGLQAVKAVIRAKPIYRDVILAKGLDVQVDVIIKPSIDIECTAEQFDAVWSAVREALHGLAGRCGCGEDIPFGWDRCADCAKGVTRPVDEAAAFQVLPSYKRGF